VEASKSWTSYASFFNFLLSCLWIVAVIHGFSSTPDFGSFLPPQELSEFEEYVLPRLRLHQSALEDGDEESFTSLDAIIEKSAKKVLLFGQSGVGKSILCRELYRIFDPLDEFESVVLICSHDDLEKARIDNENGNNSSRRLILVDGFDRLAQDDQSRIIMEFNCFVLATASTDLVGHLFNSRFEIMPFTKAQMRNFITKAFLRQAKQAIALLSNSEKIRDVIGKPIFKPLRHHPLTTLSIAPTPYNLGRLICDADIVGIRNPELENLVNRSYQDEAQDLIKFFRNNGQLSSLFELPLFLKYLCLSRDSITSNSPQLTSLTITAVYESLFNLANWDELRNGEFIEWVYNHMIAADLTIPFSSPIPAIFTSHESWTHYFMAKYLAANSGKLKDFMTKYKYETYYEMLFVFLAGLLLYEGRNNDNFRSLILFWHFLLTQPRDLAGMRHISLVIRCWNECICAESMLVPLNSKILNEITKWLLFEDISLILRSAPNVCHFIRKDGSIIKSLVTRTSDPADEIRYVSSKNLCALLEDAEAEEVIRGRFSITNEKSGLIRITLAKFTARQFDTDHAVRLLRELLVAGEIEDFVKSTIMSELFRLDPGCDLLVSKLMDGHWVKSARINVKLVAASLLGYCLGPNEIVAFIGRLLDQSTKYDDVFLILKNCGSKIATAHGIVLTTLHQRLLDYAFINPSNLFELAIEALISCGVSGDLIMEKLLLCLENKKLFIREVARRAFKLFGNDALVFLKGKLRYSIKPAVKVFNALLLHSLGDQIDLGKITLTQPSAPDGHYLDWILLLSKCQVDPDKSLPMLLEGLSNQFLEKQSSYTLVSAVQLLSCLIDANPSYRLSYCKAIFIAVRNVIRVLSLQTVHANRYYYVAMEILEFLKKMPVVPVPIISLVAEMIANENLSTIVRCEYIRLFCKFNNVIYSDFGPKIPGLLADSRPYVRNATIVAISKFILKDSVVIFEVHEILKESQKKHLLSSLQYLDENYVSPRLSLKLCTWLDPNMELCEFKLKMYPLGINSLYPGVIGMEELTKLHIVVRDYVYEYGTGATSLEDVASLFETIDINDQCNSRRITPLMYCFSVKPRNSAVSAIELRPLFQLLLNNGANLYLLDKSRCDIFSLLGGDRTFWLPIVEYLVSSRVPISIAMMEKYLTPEVSESLFIRSFFGYEDLQSLLSHRFSDQPLATLYLLHLDNWELAKKEGERLIDTMGGAPLSYLLSVRALNYFRALRDGKLERERLMKELILLMEILALERIQRGVYGPRNQEYSLNEKLLLRSAQLENFFKILEKLNDGDEYVLPLTTQNVMGDPNIVHWEHQMYLCVTNVKDSIWVRIDHRYVGAIPRGEHCQVISFRDYYRSDWIMGDNLRPFFVGVIPLADLKEYLAAVLALWNSEFAGNCHDEKLLSSVFVVRPTNVDLPEKFRQWFPCQQDADNCILSGHGLGVSIRESKEFYHELVLYEIVQIQTEVFKMKKYSAVNTSAILDNSEMPSTVALPNNDPSDPAVSRQKLFSFLCSQCKGTERSFAGLQNRGNTCWYVIR
jgi:hypothetical protein